ncbi:MAG: porin [Desulfobulbaceae bacterium]|nr:porin [Desulfobulbaceae bacterium]
MKKKIAVAGLSLMVAAGSAYGSGYRIPEQSVNSTALAGACVAYTPGADASYFNPANMSWLDDRGYLEAGLTWINSKAVKYTDNRTPAFNGESEMQNFLLPTFFAVSPDYHNFRVGLSFTYPGGLSRQWEQPYPRTFAEEFTLKTIELNPSLSYKFCNMFSAAAGVRGVYADGKVRSMGMTPTGVGLNRYMEGDTWEAGYNLALTARPVDNMNLAVTYRSKIDLDLEGDARLSITTGPGAYDGDGAVSTPLPAVLAIAGSYTFFDQLTVELEYDRTYWSEYESLDFTYPTSLGNPVLTAYFDNPVPKNWDDSDTWRIGVSYDMKNSFTLMAGFAVDDNPVPDSALSFDLPESDAKAYSLGLRYQASEDLEIGIAYLYCDKEDRSAANSVVDGRFEDSGAHLVTFGIAYKL